MARAATAPDEAPAADHRRWLAVVAQLPVDDAAGRMKVLRMLETLGCAVLRDGVYLLPESTESRRGLQRLVDYVARIHGSAHLLAVRSADDAQTKQFRGMFDRSAKYRELTKTIQSLEAGFGVSDPAAIRHVLAKQRQEFDAIATLDFFGSPLKAKAESVLTEMEARVHAMIFPDEAPRAPAAGVARANRKYFRRAWATRTPLFVDRLASAWLIRRFIDPEAVMVWLDARKPCPATAVSFGFEGATFRNSRHRVTYEELLASFKLERNAALARIGRIVHALDTNEPGVAEAAGVATLLNGAKRRAENDDQLLAESEKTFDLLYEAYFEVPAKGAA
ncbi:MAG: chromate resistance protein [Burkholderiales bacterium]